MYSNIKKKTLWTGRIGTGNGVQRVSRTRALAHVPRSKSAILDRGRVSHAPKAHEPQPWRLGRESECL